MADYQTWRKQYEENRAFADRFMPEIKCLLGTAFIQESSQILDEQWATDLVMPYCRFAVRVRRNKWIKHFGDTFVLRAKAKGAHRSEYAKLLDLNKQHPTHLIYCWADNTDIALQLAWLIDLYSWRQAVLRRLVRPKYFASGNDRTVGFPCDPSYSRLLLQKP